MLLRRVIEHVRDQNWFAVTLDFAIVVLGILIAFEVTNWSERQQAASDLKRAEIALQSDVARVYFFALERVTFQTCRKKYTHALAERLLMPDDKWQGMSLVEQDDPQAEIISRVLRSPARQWGSRVWQAELARGTFDLMDKDRLQDFGTVFKQAESAERLQEAIQVLQARLQLLANTVELPLTERYRFYDIVAQINEHSARLEIISGQIVERIESLAVINTPEGRAAWQVILDGLPAHAAIREAIYGSCIEPIPTAFAESLVAAVVQQ